MAADRCDAARRWQITCCDPLHHQILTTLKASKNQGGQDAFSVVVMGAWLKIRPKLGHKCPEIVGLYSGKIGLSRAMQFLLWIALLCHPEATEMGSFSVKIAFLFCFSVQSLKMKILISCQNQVELDVTLQYPVCQRGKNVCLTSPCNFLNYTKPDIGHWNILSSIKRPHCTVSKRKLG